MINLLHGRVGKSVLVKDYPIPRQDYKNRASDIIKKAQDAARYEHTFFALL